MQLKVIEILMICVKQLINNQYFLNKANLKAILKFYLANAFIMFEDLIYIDVRSKKNRQNKIFYVNYHQPNFGFKHLFTSFCQEAMEYDN